MPKRTVPNGSEAHRADSVFFSELLIDFVVGVVGQLFYQRAVHISVQTYLVPVFLVPVVGAFYCGVIPNQIQIYILNPNLLHL